MQTKPTPNPDRAVAALVAPSIARRTTDSKGVPHYQYESISALGDALARHRAGFVNARHVASVLHPEARPRNNDSVQLAESLYAAVTRDDSDVDGVSFEQAVKAAQLGGRLDGLTGAHELQKKLTELHNMPHLTGTRHNLINSVAGGVASVPRALAGSPKAMLKPTRREVKAPTIRIGFHVGRVYGFSSSYMFNRAAGLLALVEGLEKNGQRVELSACWHNGSGETTASAGNALRLSVVVKRAADLYNPAALAFAAHPAFQRRLAWHHQLIEAVGAGPVRQGFADGKGRALTPSKLYDYWLPWVDHDVASNLKSPEQAFKHITTEWHKVSEKLRTTTA